MLFKPGENSIVRWGNFFKGVGCWGKGKCFEGWMRGVKTIYFTRLGRINKPINNG